MKLSKKPKTDRRAKHIVNYRNRKFILKVIREIAQRAAQKYLCMWEEKQRENLEGFIFHCRC